MADTLTPNYGWIKPEISGSPTTWGNKLNNNLDGIDAQVKTNENSATSGSSSIGDIKMFAGVTPPTGWLWCNGAVYNNTDIPLLAPVLANRFPGGNGSTTSAVPNLFGRVAVGYDGGGWGMGASGGEVAHNLTWNEMPSHNHSASQDAHVHAAWQDAHTHADTGHVHGASASQDVHSHGGVITGAQPGSVLQAGVTATLTGGRTDNQQPAVHIAINTDYAHLDNRQPAVYTDSRQPNVYTGNSGSSYGHNNMPPYTVVGFVIRYV